MLNPLFYIFVSKKMQMLACFIFFLLNYLVVLEDFCTFVTNNIWLFCR